ncbi:MAG: RHS repeat-associated core domain-containing protein [Candidatus Firestonebacteria bacterium]
MFFDLISYDAFGKVRSETPTGDTRNKNKFVGVWGVVDDSVDDGLTYMRARYYDSETGRFISRDPIGEFLIYVYCRNNPIIFIDPSGLAYVTSRPVAGGNHTYIVFTQGDGAGKTGAFFPTQDFGVDTRTGDYGWGEIKSEINNKLDMSDYKKKNNDNLIDMKLTPEQEQKLYDAIKKYNERQNRSQYKPGNNNCNTELKKLLKELNIDLPSGVTIGTLKGVQKTK